MRHGPCLVGGMGVRRIDDLIAWQLAVQFKREVYRLVRESKSAEQDFRHRSQLFSALSSTEANIVEGFSRRSPKQFRLFLGYARASHAEAETHLKDGIDRGYFSQEACAPALVLAKRCGMAILRLLQSLAPFIKE
jgi:four helix bundle protein